MYIFKDKTIMLREDKELLFSDLCARLPYGVFVKDTYSGHYGRMCKISQGYVYYVSKENCNHLEERPRYIKPYLRPMSSMTEDEKNELHNNSEEKWANALDFSLSPVSAGECSVELESIAEAADIDWLYSHHFDFRDLIKKGLALEAPENMYKTDDYDKEE